MAARHRASDAPGPKESERGSDAPPTDDDGWSLAEALGGASLGSWVAVGLVAVGGYLVLAQVFPALSLPGSLVMGVAGVIILWLHVGHRLGPWALYAGAVLAAVGGLRVVAGFLPLNVNGETALGLGLALLAIGHLRATQAGGYGWQGAVGIAALAFGGLQFALGVLPGEPGILDLLVPTLILGGGILLLLRTAGRRTT